MSISIDCNKLMVWHFVCNVIVMKYKLQTAAVAFLIFLSTLCSAQSYQIVCNVPYAPPLQVCGYGDYEMDNSCMMSNQIMQGDYMIALQAYQQCTEDRLEQQIAEQQARQAQLQQQYNAPRN